MLSPDNYVHPGLGPDGYNRYAYAGNNPLKYVDPSGEVIIPILFFTDFGYEVQKYVSPVALHVDVHFSSETRGIGVSASVGVPKLVPISYRRHLGATYYSRHYDNSYQGWETRSGGEWTLAGVLSYSGTTYRSGETSQTTNMITIGGAWMNLKYENDFMFGVNLPGVPAADNGDRYRTAALKFSIGPLSAGFNLFTGDSGVPFDERETRTINGRETYVSNGEKDPDEYRSGVLYVGVGPFRLGRNSEGIRNFIQNRVAHDILIAGVRGEPAPYFLVLDRDPSWYYYVGSGTVNSLW